MFSIRCARIVLRYTTIFYELLRFSRTYFWAYGWLCSMCSAAPQTHADVIRIKPNLALTIRFVTLLKMRNEHSRCVQLQYSRHTISDSIYKHRHKHIHATHSHSSMRLRVCMFVEMIATERAESISQSVGMLRWVSRRDTSNEMIHEMDFSGIYAP